MSDVFPKWTNRLPRNLAIGLLLVGMGVVVASNYYFTPKYTQVGYSPIQPVAFSHNTHVSQVGMDCRYCHSGIEKSAVASVPSTSLCMNCHGQILRDDPRLSLVRDSAVSGEPIPWIRIHKLPDYVYFNHAVHSRRGVSCYECHGPVHKMDQVYQAQPMSMAFCLDCHRNPRQKIQPIDKVTDLEWVSTNAAANLTESEQRAKDWKIQPLDNCATCHR